jgi:lipopolysaccharide transport system ATP-binding protein
MKPVLEIKNISKKFRISHEGRSYLSLRDSIAGLFERKSRSTEDFYALSDVSFDVYPGESVGIIGKNGAGKSTLLKILSKITPPTSGTITCRGRIASLLEVGTGFHPELSGRENVFFNGSILGMKKKEILKNFDAIVDFAGVEKFLDTPLKHYSSGMQLRLAFAVAAFLENEILVIDEVLAVGDAEFQKKCMGKMSDVSKSGRTILFVSHHLGSVNQLCSKGVLLKNGKVDVFGKASEVVNAYMKQFDSTDTNIFSNQKKNKAEPYFETIIPTDKSGVNKTEFSFFEPVVLNMKVRKSPAMKSLMVGIGMMNRSGNRLFSHFYEISNTQAETSVSIELPAELIAPGSYSFVAALLENNNLLAKEEEICPVRIIETGSEFSRYEGYELGDIIPKCKWSEV